METKTLDEIISDLKIEYTAEFVPFSKSRNAKEVKKATDLSLNWKISLKKKNNLTLTTDYSEGIGHIPNFKHKSGYTVDEWENLKYICEQGKLGKYMPSIDSYLPGKKLDPPKLKDVLYCLVLDSDALDHANFEEWADNFGYSTDSRSAEKIYKECLSIGLQLRRLIGESNLSLLREAFQDY